jgi:hypothetical protein
MKISVLVIIAFAAIAQSAASSGCGNPLSKNLTRGGVGKTNLLNFTTSDGVVRR